VFGSAARESPERLVLAGETRASALRQAQRDIKALDPDSFYWGAFICQGDVGPLATISTGLNAAG
jgi:hypothetical protein